MAVPASLALTNVADGAQITASPHRNNYAAIQTAVNALIGFLSAGNSGSILKWDGTNWTYTTNVTIDDSTSKITFGGDTNVYRDVANSLKTDDDFSAALDVTARRSVAGQTIIGARGPASQSGVAFGDSSTGALDTFLYRSAAATLKTDGALTVLGAFTASGADAHMEFDAGIALGAGLGLKFNTVGNRRLECGAADSGGAGYRTVRIAN